MSGFQTWRKKPVEVQAALWNPAATRWFDWTDAERLGGVVAPTSYIQVAQLLGTSGCSREEPYWDWTVLGVIHTLEGKHIVRPGDWVIRGLAGEHYPCAPSIFNQTYESA